MADVKISELPAASALVAGDLFPAVQDDGGLVTRKATAAQIGAYVRGLAGTVRQVVSAVTSSDVVVNGTTWTDTGLSVSITPTSASSKVLVLASQSLRMLRTGTGAEGGLRLLRASTVILAYSEGQFAFNQTGATGAANIGLVAPVMFLDSPATTGAVTYSLQMRGTTADDEVRAQFYGESASSIVAVEIAA
jgi:hypothetical protein